MTRTASATSTAAAGPAAAAVAVSRHRAIGVWLGMADLVCCMPLGAVPLEGWAYQRGSSGAKGTFAGRTQRASEAAYA